VSTPRRKTATVAKLERAKRGQLRLARRDGEDLVLESARHAEDTEAAMSATTRLFVSLMKRDDGARALLTALPDVFPWVRFLPAEDVRGFLVELVETANACADLDSMAPLRPVIDAWKDTALIHADPELRDQLKQPLDGADYGPVTIEDA
jgi:hypothetical protein